MKIRFYPLGTLGAVCFSHSESSKSLGAACPGNRIPRFPKGGVVIPTAPPQRRGLTWHGIEASSSSLRDMSIQDARTNSLVVCSCSPAAKSMPLQSAFPCMNPHHPLDCPARLQCDDVNNNDGNGIFATLSLASSKSLLKYHLLSEATLPTLLKFWSVHITAIPVLLTLLHSLGFFLMCANHENALYRPSTPGHIVDQGPQLLCCETHHCIGAATPPPQGSCWPKTKAIIETWDSWCPAFAWGLTPPHGFSKPGLLHPTFSLSPHSRSHLHGGLGAPWSLFWQPPFLPPTGMSFKELFECSFLTYIILWSTQTNTL